MSHGVKVVARRVKTRRGVLPTMPHPRFAPGKRYQKQSYLRFLDKRCSAL